MYIRYVLPYVSHVLDTTLCDEVWQLDLYSTSPQKQQWYISFENSVIHGYEMKGA
jgi:hypothetical protein